MNSIYKIDVRCQLPGWEVVMASNTSFVLEQAMVLLRGFLHSGIYEVEVYEKANNHIVAIEDTMCCTIENSHSNYNILKNTNWTKELLFILYSLLDDYTSTYQNKHFIALHGGVIRGECGLSAIVGGTHSGKSTLLTYLINKGYEFYSDDYIFIDIETHFVYKYPQLIRLRNLNVDCLNNIKVQCEIINISNGQKEYLVEIPFHDNVTNSSLEKLQQFVFIERAQQLHCTSITSQIELFSLLLQNVKRISDLTKWQLLVSIANESKGWHLEYSSLQEVSVLF